MDGEKKKARFSLGYLILAFWAVLLLQQILSTYLQAPRMSATAFKAAGAAGRAERGPPGGGGGGSGPGTRRSTAASKPRRARPSHRAVARGPRARTPRSRRS